MTKGSPPRMREELLVLVERLVLPRITPAHAGRIYAFLHGRSPVRDHPRACGKNNVRLLPFG